MVAKTEVRLSLGTAISRVLLEDPLLPDEPTLSDYRAALERAREAGEPAATPALKKLQVMPDQIKEALISLGAIGDKRAVRTHVLALFIDADSYKTCECILRTLASNTLSEFAIKLQSGLCWRVRQA